MGMFEEAQAADKRDAMLESEINARVRDIIASYGETNSLEQWIRREWEWSQRTFGPGMRTKGICEHIRKELTEIEKSPHDLIEWIDVIILALDGYKRHGGDPAMIMTLLNEKQKIIFARVWPDWRGRSEDEAIEHDRSEDI